MSLETTYDYQHFYNRQRRPVVTVCYLRRQSVAEDGTVEKEPRTFIGIAICSDKDRPNKKAGNAIARERANYAYREDAKVPLIKDGIRAMLLPVIRKKALSILLGSDFNCAGNFDPFPSGKAFAVYVGGFRFKRLAR